MQHGIKYDILHTVCKECNSSVCVCVEYIFLFLFFFKQPNVTLTGAITALHSQRDMTVTKCHGVSRTGHGYGRRPRVPSTAVTHTLQSLHLQTITKSVRWYTHTHTHTHTHR